MTFFVCFLESKKKLFWKQKRWRKDAKEPHTRCGICWRWLCAPLLPQSWQLPFCVRGWARSSRFLTKLWEQVWLNTPSIVALCLCTMVCFSQHRVAVVHDINHLFSGVEGRQTQVISVSSSYLTVKANNNNVSSSDPPEKQSALWWPVLEMPIKHGRPSNPSWIQAYVDCVCIFTRNKKMIWMNQVLSCLSLFSF